MAITPWHVANYVSLEEAAALLAGEEPYLLQYAGSDSDSEYRLAYVFAWKEKIIQAVGLGYLKPQAVKAYIHIPEAMMITPEGTDMGPKVWIGIKPTDLFKHACRHNEVKMNIFLTEIYAWLKSIGISDEDIPHAIRPPKGTQEAESDGMRHNRGSIYERLIAAMVVILYGREVTQPYSLAEKILSDCAIQNFEAPGSRTALGDLLKSLQRGGQAMTEVLHPKRERTYQRLVVAMIAIQYGNENTDPHSLAEEILKDCEDRHVEPPEDMDVLGEFLKALPPAQQANLD